MDDVAVMDVAAPDVTEPPATDRRSRGRLSPERIVRYLGWFVPVGLFGYFFGFALLNITRVFPLLRGDWASYIAAPNFVRDGPWLSFPIGRIPGYMAPVGTWLGQVDAMPALYPVYRVLSIAMPHRPFQLIGWELLGSMVATFGIVRAYLRREALTASANALRAELVATAGAVALLAQPYYLVRAGHAALFQMWVIPWALIVSLRMIEDRRGGDNRVTVWAFLAPVAAAAALNPYLALMVLPVLCTPLLCVTSREHIRDTAIRIAAAAGVFLGVSLLFGYIGTGGRSASNGFGLYMADAGLLVDGGGQSKVWPNTPPNLTLEGFGFPGTALLVLAAVVGLATFVNRLRRGAVAGNARLWPIWLAVGLTLLWAMLPVIRLFDRPVLDLNEALAPFDSVTSSVRSNGRFAWPFVWLVSLLTVRHLARNPRALAHVAVALAAVIQVADAVRPGIPEAEDKYGPAMAIVREAVAEGVTRIEFQPPNVWTDCPAHEWGPLENIAQLVVAGAVEGLAVNSGYPSRGDDRLLHEICEGQRNAYLAGHLEPDVLYVIPPGVEPVSSDLRCRPTDLAATICRLAHPTAEEGSDE
jgi:hypothetical protein